MDDDLPHGRVTTDAAACHGQPHIRDTRVLITVILDVLAVGESRFVGVGDCQTLPLGNNAPTLRYGLVLQPAAA